MKREIKFRCWCDKNNEMYYPDGHYEFWIDNNSIGFYPRYDKDELQHYNTIPAEHEKEIIIMQYTGLKDKNGKEIYEGDIVRYPYFRYRKQTIVITDVYWYHHGFYIRNNQTKLIDSRALMVIKKDGEIIGNIYKIQNF